MGTYSCCVTLGNVMDEDAAHQRIEELRPSHTPEAVRERQLRGPTPSNLRDVIYGATDGIVTT
ncbi:MAG: hypothetical protein J4O04_06705, partial [Chloroflexi bacterium]|nr:hypothetical protein [Chloroflexota bacterium]